MNISKRGAVSYIAIIIVGLIALTGFDNATGGHIKDAPAAANQVIGER